MASLVSLACDRGPVAPVVHPTRADTSNTSDSSDGRADRRAPLLEDEEGVIGGPIDATDFEFEPELSELVPPVLDGMPEPSEAVRSKLAPYLDARRVKLAGVLPSGGLLVLGRHGATTQALAIREPGADATPLTAGSEPVVQASAVPGRPDELLFRRDAGGDEDHQLFLRDHRLGVETLLTDGTSRHGPFRVAGNPPVVVLTGNARSEPDMDLYVRVGAERAPSLAKTLDGQWVAVALRSDGGEVLLRRFWSVDRSYIYRYDLARDVLRPLSADETGAHTDLDARYLADGSVLLVGDRGDAFVGLHRLGGDGEWSSLTPHLAWDVEGATSLAGGKIAYTINEDGRSRLFVRDPSGSTRELDLPRGGVVSGLRAADPETLVFASSSAVQPADVYTLQVDRGVSTRWTDSPTGADATRFVHPRLARVGSQDGVQVPAFVYAPTGAGPHPVLLWMHGGPEDQFRPDFNPIIQYFVARGIAVVGPNVRGSDGYGRHYRGLDNGVARGGAIADVGALLDWIAAEPTLDEARVGIVGASYGGFMVLASLVAYPDRFAAGCDMVGISNIVTFLENTRGYRRDLRRAEYGDERDPEVRAALEQLSPLNAIERVRAPLFVAHGANDPRVPVSEAEQVVEALRQQGREVWYMLAPNEGHSFRKANNRDIYYASMATFFERHLLGPPSDATRNSD